jgi:hypothetical protein
MTAVMASSYVLVPSYSNAKGIIAEGIQLLIISRDDISVIENRA